MATNIERHGTDRFTIAVAEVNGWRNSMEDAHVCVTKDNWGYFGILDGHGGTECSKWCAARLVKYLNSDGCPKTDAEAKALILKVDAEFLATAQKSGSTAAMCSVKQMAGGRNLLHVINAGDSRVLLGSKTGKIYDGGGTDQGLTFDHKPDYPSERKRIYRCGGTVEAAAGGVHRVNGDLAVSRGFGDAEHKKTGGPAQEDRPVTCDPEMGHFEATTADFLLIVCDGVSEGDYPNPEVIEHAAKVLRETGDPGLACSAVCHRAVERNSKDNVSVMMVLFEPATKRGASHEFVPGPLTGVDNSGWVAAYSEMAKRGGLSFAKACEMRYEALTRRGYTATPAEIEELTGFGEVTGDKQAYFEQWATGKESAASSGGAGESDQMAMLMQMMRARGQGGIPGMQGLLNGMGGGQEEPEDGRRVRVTPIAALRASVDEHAALKWDDRMAELAGSVGIVKTDDASDGTTHVRFPPPLGVVAWLPTEALTDVEE